MTTDSDIERVRQALPTIPFLRSYKGPIERLGGLTNMVFRLGEYCVRLPGRGTEEYINRENEAVAAQAAAAVGVSPEILYIDRATGDMVSRFVEGAMTMSPEAFRSVAGAPTRAGIAFRKLHDSGAVFPARFELFAMIDEYLGVLSTKDVDLPDGYHDALREAASVREALSVHPLPNVSCHCDPLCENFLDTGHRMWVVDWEYCGMNDPMWDLADLSVEGEFDAAQEEEMIHAYFGGEPTPFERGRIVIYKAMCDLLWTLWGLIQLANRNPAADFRAYADTRFARCQALMRTDAFRTALADVAQG
ncbi:MAG: phosphotransferase family protein [Rhizobiaceae bacterium]|nr:phosphotransferase family protein [Rhizobiaceae bacterium]